MGELTDSVGESSSVWASLLWANSHVGELTVKPMIKHNTRYIARTNEMMKQYEIARTNAMMKHNTRQRALTQ